MKKNFSTKWNSSKQPRKQRKFRAKAPLHIKQKFMGATLSKSIRAKLNLRTLPVRLGDKVKILRGQFKGKEGKVDGISRLKCKVYVLGAEFNKIDGSKAMYPIHPSNVMITDVTEDGRRFNKSQLSTSKPIAPAPEEKVTNIEAKAQSNTEEKVTNIEAKAQSNAELNTKSNSEKLTATVIEKNQN